MSEREQVSGSVERVTYYNAENGYSVIRLKPDRRGMLPFKYASGRDGLVTAVGNLPEVNPGEWLKLSGQWVAHAKHGRQFQVELCEQSLPATTEGIKRYLGSGMIRGVGPVMAERIVNRFGDETLEVIDHDPERLLTVLGIGKKRVKSILKSWAEQRAIKDVMIFLQSHGVSTALAIKIYKKYGDDSLAIVQNKPYQMVRDIYGIGFKTADKIAQALGLAPDDPARIEAGIAYTLNRMAEEGHVYMPQEELEPEAAEILGVEAAKVTQVLEQLESSDFVKRERLQYSVSSDQYSVSSGQYSVGSDQQPTTSSQLPATVREEQAVYLTPFYYSEIGVTQRVKGLVAEKRSRLANGQWSMVNRQLPISLSEQQEGAVRTAVTHKVTILTGGPGTGKTTTLRALLDLLDANKRSFVLASPTGRAAKRLTEATGREAKTIHRLLEYNPAEGFGRNEQNPIDADMVVIDEASMLDLVLANNLLKAIDPASHLLLVGDVDQLPSVGAGDVLRDLMASGVTAVIRLDTIFRQAAGSLIIQNAHRINHGQMPIASEGGSDFYTFIKQDPAETADLLVDIVQKRLPHKFGLHPLDDIQVLAPMYNGGLGVSALNERLQAALNPPGQGKAERRLGGRVFRVGDKVMQTVNNYDKNVYNGDIGRITAVDLLQQTITINLDGAPVVYDFLEMDEMVHAYCISVHKSQGAEYPCVVLPVVMQHYMMLQRNLLYTAVTRAKKLVILIGTRKAISIAVKNNKTTQRHTALDWRLQQ
ncbi:MAG: ATP-dependent RecD-like DNA helicase [Ardenticatenaceae bacterium]|nr:ATP-dependent RecD-like DNA helicase [Anaerolineales bacterium]MCB8922896.1 ATP-dependent RecD-like DNA helicase [Ardenticatenaceae bacterium]MCB8990368.1 ATP-dependent RecD-like DNA helicase [Ardenticatenaceae bacterium]MCB9005261.1 ATP-dependent RecD-like DNA helicase [Ardenticatenaceae bacterium]